MGKRVVATALAGLLAAAAICAGTASGASTSDSPTGQIATSTVKACGGSVLYGVSRISVKRVVGRVSCPTARGLARSAVAYRVKNGFPTKFCVRGWCWSFGEFRSRGEGSSIVAFKGSRGSRRIAATQQVS